MTLDQRSKGEGLMVFSRKPICQVPEANRVSAAQWVCDGKGRVSVCMQVVSRIVNYNYPPGRLGVKASGVGFLLWQQSGTKQRERAHSSVNGAEEEEEEEEEWWEDDFEVVLSLLQQDSYLPFGFLALSSFTSRHNMKQKCTSISQSADCSIIIC